MPVTDEIIVHQVSDLEVVDEFTFRECCGLAVRVPEHPATDIERPSPAYRVPYGYLSILPAPGL